MLRALLLAPPGAGKGTQGEGLAEAYQVPHLATGDLLRRHVAEGSALGVQARGFMDRGELVPDGLVLNMVHGQVWRRPGFVLDGFPRTLDQAKEAYRWALVKRRTFHAVISLVVPDDELVRRLLDRGRSSGRSDDTESIIRHRLGVYGRNTEPLFEFYRARAILVEVDGVGPVDMVTARVCTALDRLQAASPQGWPRVGRK
jgi:adenylate kinase